MTQESEEKDLQRPLIAMGGIRTGKHNILFEYVEANLDQPSPQEELKGKEIITVLEGQVTVLILRARGYSFQTTICEGDTNEFSHGGKRDKIQVMPESVFARVIRIKIR